MREVTYQERIRAFLITFLYDHIFEPVDEGFEQFKKKFNKDAKYYVSPDIPPEEALKGTTYVALYPERGNTVMISHEGEQVEICGFSLAKVQDQKSG